MSFYAGKYNGKTQCHLTHGQHALSTMRGGVFSGTIFHTDVAYPTYESYTITSQAITKVTYWPGTRYPPPEDQWPRVNMVRIPSTAHTKLKAGAAYLLLDSNDNIILPVPMTVLYGANDDNVGKIGVGVNWGPYVDPTTSSIPPHYVTMSPGYVGTASVEYTGEVAAIVSSTTTVSRILVFNFGFNGYTKYPVMTNSEIIIKPGVFNVGGIALQNLKYISTYNINTTDITGAQIGQGFTPFQLVNSKNSTGAVTMQSNSSGTFLKIGNKYILRSDYPVPTYKSIETTSGTVQNNVFGERLIMNLNTTAVADRSLIFGSLQYHRTTYISSYVYHSYREEAYLFVYTEGKTYYLQHGVHGINVDYWSTTPNPMRSGGYYIKCVGGYLKMYSNIPSLGGLADDIVTQDTADIVVSSKIIKMN